MFEKPTPVDWPRIIRSMQARGATLRSIEQQIGIDHVTIDSWARGCEPAYSSGAALLALWYSMFKKPDQSIPTILPPARNPQRSHEHGPSR